MSWLYSRALVEEFSAATCSDGARSAQLSVTPMPLAFLPSARMTAFSGLSQSGTTFGHLTDGLGADVLMWFLEGFPVRPIHQRLRAETLLTISGRKCDGSWQMSLPGTYGPRTSKDAQSIARPTTWRRWATRPAALPFPRRTWVVTMFGGDIGYLHTPTCTANYAAPSMQKWPSARAFTKVFGKPSPTNHEWLMDWPIGWTDLRPLAMAKFQQWLRWHSMCSAERSQP